jgi:hypothetical protein
MHIFIVHLVKNILYSIGKWLYLDKLEIEPSHCSFFFLFFFLFYHSNVLKERKKEKNSVRAYICLYTSQSMVNEAEN